MLLRLESKMFPLQKGPFQKENGLPSIIFFKFSKEYKVKIKKHWLESGGNAVVLFMHEKHDNGRTIEKKTPVVSEILGDFSYNI